MKEIEKFKLKLSNTLKLSQREVKLSVSSANKLLSEITDLETQLLQSTNNPAPEQKNRKIILSGDKF